MPQGYHHLTYEQRCQIYVLLKRGTSKTQIAAEVGVVQSTVSREIWRNKGKRGYRYKQAQRKCEIRRKKASSQKRKMTPEVTLYVDQKLRDKQWSPEQIAGRLKVVSGKSLSHESIYRYVWKNKREGGILYQNLRHNGKKYNKRRNITSGRGLIPGRIGIEQRPAIVETKERVGDFEMDTIIGSKHRGAIVSLVDRKTKITRLALLARPIAQETSQAVVRSLYPLRSHVHTLTADNGKEFAQHAFMARALEAKVFFANPYHAWERGLNENTNGLVRQYFPKKCDFTKLTHEQVQTVEYLLNTRPRKALNYQTPHEIFLQITGMNLDYALRC